MTDKFKDQDSMLPAATIDKKKIGAKSVKPAKDGRVIINPPLKTDRDSVTERFVQALRKHTVIIEKKTELVLQSKATRADLPEETLTQVFTRGYKALPLNSELTREQYAMNRVNSFVAGGAAMLEDCDLLPITERTHTRMGVKGTGGAMRPHIKREKSPYNGKTVYHVVDAKGSIKHSTGDEFEAKKHLATKYNSYMGESAPVKPLRHAGGPGMKDEYSSIRRPVPNGKKEVKEGTLSPLKRFEGTKSLVKTYKADTPGESVKEETLSELNRDTLHSYVNKADKQIVAKHRVLGPQIKAGDAKAANKTSATIGKRMVGMDRAVERLNKEETSICASCQVDPCICDDSHGFVNEARMSAALRLHAAWEKQRAKSNASLARTPSSIPKPEPKKEESK